MCGRDDPDIDLLRQCFAEANDLALLQDTQQLVLTAIGTSPISSRRSVPPFAASNNPRHLRWRR
jgi:hypothetical protein